MLKNLPIFPPSASSVAGDVDMLFFFLVAVSAVFTALIAIFIVFFAVKYRRRYDTQIGEDVHGGLALELTWTIIPLALTMVMFVWGAVVYFTVARPPRDAMDFYVTGKQWMWKIQHPDGIREINELHVPINRAVRLTMGSEDVIHDFSIPAFRVKMDVVPGKLTTMWFMATVPGEYHLFCSQYCGTRHSGMIGTVYAMTPEAYAAWLASGHSTGTTSQNGARLFSDLSCITCHKGSATGRGPTLIDLYGSRVTLSDGRTIVADENYIRESIMSPQSEVVQGYQPIMPTFQGALSEDNLLQLIAYIKTMKTEPGTAARPGTEK